MDKLYEEFAKLKKILRRGWVVRDIEGRTESDAEHCFSMAILALKIIHDKKIQLDEAKVLKMVLYHEIGETEVGDIIPADNIPKSEKLEKEFICVKRISQENNMPEILSLWLEFEENKTPEAKFVKAMDKFDAVMQSKIYSQDLDRLDVFNEFFNGSQRPVWEEFEEFTD